MVVISGKAFEEKFKNDWKRTVPESTLDRLYDVQFGYKSVDNVCDFICYKYPNIYFLECKAHKGSSLPFDAFPQYDKLILKSGIKGVRAGVVLFLYEKSKVLYIPVSTIKQIKEAGEKSVGLRHLDSHRIFELPSMKKRVFMDTDYSYLVDNLEEGD